MRRHKENDGTESKSWRVTKENDNVFCLDKAQHFERVLDGFKGEEQKYHTGIDGSAELGNAVYRVSEMVEELENRNLEHPKHYFFRKEQFMIWEQVSALITRIGIKQRATRQDEYDVVERLIESIPLSEGDLNINLTASKEPFHTKDCNMLRIDTVLNTIT